MASTTPTISVPVSSITVELFLLGGPNCFETKPIDAEAYQGLPKEGSQLGQSGMDY
ncbi:hypothetical protein DAPPUDRAFT_257050 [Daphnia pulex]|uniref:Uncharacterized protein n=1 Tax=Daphnia pulex TaxID=6669 RepID=E9HCI8_DAPPU|nr:hypothetical protein DAPPUDRAFT_257050 [Daphnia pulex]|eukprot:EFX70525.1 hypothetical protein DAPPUDRAFT_257050 [Daphnia pulex]